MAIRLRFSRTNSAPPVRLHFGEAPPEITPCIATGLTVAPVGISGGELFTGMFISSGSVGPRSYVGGVLDQRRMVDATFRTAYSALSSLSIHKTVRQSLFPHVSRSWRGNIPRSLAGDNAIRGRYEFLRTAQNPIRTGYAIQDKVDSSERVRYDKLDLIQFSSRGGYDVLGGLSAGSRIRWIYFHPVNGVWRGTYPLEGQSDTAKIIPYSGLIDLPIHTLCNYGISTNPIWVWPRERRPVVPPTPISIPAHIFFYRINTSPEVVPLHFGKSLIPPRSKRILVMNPTCSVVRLPDRLVLRVFSITISEQIDSLAKTFSLQTDWDGRQALFEGGNPPNPLEATINGYVWTFVAESYRESAQFGSRRYTVIGYCQNILLASPHSLIRSHTEENTRLASQLALQELPQDWSLSWQIVDWLIPAGVWTYQDLDPIHAISRIVSTAGGFLQSHLTTKVLIARPIYSTSAWALANASPTAIIAGDSQISVEVEYPQNALSIPYNGVFVSGVSQGVAGLIRIPQTQGEKQLILENDALILDTTVLRERGREVLSMNYPRPTLNVQTPLQPPPGSPGLLRPGDIVEIRTGYAILRDIVMSCEITVNIQNNGLVVRQNLRVGASVANPWVAMDSLFPRSPMLSVGVLAHNPDGTSTVELPGGSTIRVQGQSVAVGNMAFIKDDRIIGGAPDLPTYTLDAFNTAPV